MVGRLACLFWLENLPAQPRPRVIVDLHHLRDHSIRPTIATVYLAAKIRRPGMRKFATAAGDVALSVPNATHERTGNRDEDSHEGRTEFLWFGPGQRCAQVRGICRLGS